MEERDMSQVPSIVEPQIEPNGHIYVLLQDHGQHGGGWGPAAISIPEVEIHGPVVYTGTDQTAIDALMRLTHEVWSQTGKPTKFVKFTEMEEIVSWE